MLIEEILAAKVRVGRDAEEPILVLMHFLGGSTREWDEVIPLLGDHVGTVALDLPGFGDSAGVPGYSVAEMADAVEQTIQQHVSGRYVLVGHSMSGKVAMVLAARAQKIGEDSKLAGLVLVAPSPPSPEPIDDAKRSMMMGLLGLPHGAGNAEDLRDDRARARAYITKNEARDIPEAVIARAVSEVLKMNRAAWVAWLMQGSKEDWAERVGLLELPVMVIAGEKDLSLGPKQQRALSMAHMHRGVLRTVPGCSHLIPMECPSVMAMLLLEFLEGLPASSEALVPAEYREFLAGERVSPKTREVLEARMDAPEFVPGVLTSLQLETLRAMLARVIPQAQPGIDLAGYVLARLASGKGDGWRYDVLPKDVEAYRAGLDRLAGADFLDLDGDAQDAMLTKLASVKGSAEARWFEEVRGDATSAYVGHPATMARLGYSGIGVGGADTRYQGYVTLEANAREDWEPVAAGERGR